MADELLRSKHAFGDSENVDQAISEKTVDAFDILFLDGATDPKIGWVDKEGRKVIVENGVKEDAVDAKLATVKDEANAYADKKVEAALEEFERVVDGVDYEVVNIPTGTLVNHRDKEIRIMCPEDTEWKLQQSGENADKSKFYIGFKAYAPSDDVVNFKEDLAEVIADDTMYAFEGNEFAGVDELGRKYSIVWLPVAVHDEVNDVWTYYGASSTEEKYIGWHYSVEWYNADGILIDSDCVRINLSNEGCHNMLEPFYLANVTREMKIYTDEQIKAISASFGVVEF